MRKALGVGARGAIVGGSAGIVIPPADRASRSLLTPPPPSPFYSCHAGYPFLNFGTQNAKKITERFK